MSVQNIIDEMKRFGYYYLMESECTFEFDGGKIEFDSWRDALRWVRKLSEFFDNEWHY